MQKEIVIALVTSAAALVTSLISAYVSLRKQKKEEMANSTSSKLSYLNKKLEILENVKTEMLKPEKQDIPDNDDFMIEAGIRVQEIYFRRLDQLKSIEHYLDERKIDNVVNRSKEITTSLAKLKIFSSNKNQKKEKNSKEMKAIVEMQPHKIMAEEIKNIELLIDKELREAVMKIDSIIDGV
ncbi:MAG: hypothetical protein GWP10_07285 [Nitrospiraceae bacterium]|nr:hypothetical protein [Nitrospiraceae bacterium]